MPGEKYQELGRRNRGEPLKARGRKIKFDVRNPNYVQHIYNVLSSVGRRLSQGHTTRCRHTHTPQVPARVLIWLGDLVGVAQNLNLLLPSLSRVEKMEPTGL